MSSLPVKSLSRRDFLKISALTLGSLALSRAVTRQSDRLRLIHKYGPATRLPALEFHGDNYYMYDGAYSMNPETFKVLMRWFQNNEVWAVSSDELVGFLLGDLDLPSRSVILTTDSASVSQTSLARMIPVLQETGMHFISLIWTRYMRAGESVTCVDDACWNAFREAQDSGTFSFGSHTETHRDMAELSQQDGLADLLESKLEIEESLGISPQLISWPFESVPTWAPILAEHGFVAAFAGGGSRKTMTENVVRISDPSPWDLPRLLPPNIGTLTSGRPAGKTLPEMMSMFTDGFGETAKAWQARALEEQRQRSLYHRSLRPPR